MGRSGYLIDSNVIIDYLGEKLPPKGMMFLNEVVDATPKISIITKIEVLCHKPDIHTEKVLANFMTDAIVFGLSEEIGNKCIELRKSIKIKLPDALIAATAIVYGYTLITRNVKDFVKIDTLSIINPHDNTII